MNKPLVNLGSGIHLLSKQKTRSKLLERASCNGTVVLAHIKQHVN